MRDAAAARASSAVRIALALAAVAPLSGCCAIAGLFCGPDKSRWVSVGYESADAALQTFLEAARRDNATVLYECLGPGFKDRLQRQYGLEQLTGVEMAVVWEKLKEQNRGLHLIGTAEIVAQRAVEPAADPPAARPRVRRQYDLEVAGRAFSVVVAREPYLRVRYRVDDEVAPFGRYVEAIAPYVSVSMGDEEITHTLLLRIPELMLPEDVRPEDIEHVAAGHLWKVDDIAGVQQ